jgi:uncharacterized protein (DUF302 family)
VIARSRLLSYAGALLAATELPLTAGAATSPQSPPHRDEAVPMPVIKQSRYPHSETVARLSRSIAQGGNTLFATIDQTAAARQAGMTLRPTSLIIFGNPKAGTLLMEASPLVALDLPLKLLVWEDRGVVSVAYTPMSEVANRYTISGKESVIAAIDTGLTTLTDSVV